MQTIPAKPIMLQQNRLALLTRRQAQWRGHVPLGTSHLRCLWPCRCRLVGRFLPPGATCPVPFCIGHYRLTI